MVKTENTHLLCKGKYNHDFSKIAQSGHTANNHSLPENTHILCKLKDHCMADHLFDSFGFGQTSKSVVD